jgi:flagellar FliL protein
MKAAPKTDEAPPKAKSKMMIIIIIAVVVLAAAGGGAWFMMKGKGDDHAPASAPKKAKAAKSAPPEYVPLASFTVNLQPEGESGQYLQVEMTLQVAGAEQAELFKVNMAKARNRVLILLSSKKASEISTSEGKQQLAKEIVEVTKQPFVDKGDEQEVTEVLFTSFIIQ